MRAPHSAGFYPGRLRTSPLSGLNASNRSATSVAWELRFLFMCFFPSSEVFSFCWSISQAKPSTSAPTLDNKGVVTVETRLRLYWVPGENLTAVTDHGIDHEQKARYVASGNN